MSDEKMRAEFEAALTKHMPHADLRFDGENYASEWASVAWWGWQASRAALVVELPPPLDADEIDDDLFGPVEIADGVNEIIARCSRAIEAAGVKVKP